MALPLRLPRDERDYGDAPASYIGLRAMGMIGIIDRQMANLSTPLPEGARLTTIDPVVDVVGLFDPQPGLLRINKDYGWLRAADVLAEGDPDLLADVAASTHALVEARRQAWHLEHSLWAATKMPKDANAVAGTLSLVREQKERVRAAVEQRKQLGFPLPDGCAAWWTEYEHHAEPRPGPPSRHARGAGLTPPRPPSDGRSAQPAPAPEHGVEVGDRRHLDADAQHPEGPHRRNRAHEIGEVLPEEPGQEAEG